MNYFRVIPENFFSVLSSTNKNLYINTAKLIFDKTVEIGVLNVHKDELVEVLEDFYRDSNYVYVDEAEKLRGYRDTALIILRKLKSFGWLDENIVSFNSFYNLTDIAITQIDAIERMNDYEISYTGEIFTIYSLITNRRSNVSIPLYDLMMQISRSTATFFRNMSKVNNQLKKSIGLILESEDINEVIGLLIDYITNYHESAFAKLGDTKNNVYYFRKEIIQNIEVIEKDPFEFDDYVTSIQTEKKTSKKEAEEVAKNTLHSIKSTFESYDLRHKNIESNNNKLLRSVNMKISFLQSNYKSTTGMINNIIKSCENEKSFRLIQDNINLNEHWYMSSGSFYSKRNSNIFVPQKMVDDKISFESKVNDFIDRNTTRYTKKDINRIVLNLLDDNKSLKASELSTEVHDLYVLLLYIVVYSPSSELYRINRTDDNIVFGDKVLNDFVIEVKRNA